MKFNRWQWRDWLYLILRLLKASSTSTALSGRKPLMLMSWNFKPEITALHAKSSTDTHVPCCVVACLLWMSCIFAIVNSELTAWLIVIWKLQSFIGFILQVLHEIFSYIFILKRWESWSFLVMVFIDEWGIESAWGLLPKEMRLYELIGSVIC